MIKLSAYNLFILFRRTVAFVLLTALIVLISAAWYLIATKAIKLVCIVIIKLATFKGLI